MSYPQNPGGYGGAPPGGGGGGWYPPAGGGPPGGGWAPPPAGAPPGGYGPPPGVYGPPGGYPQQGYGGGSGGGPRTEPLALPTLICGILSIPAMFCCYAGVPLAIASVVMGIIALGKISSHPEQNEGKGMVIAGMICAGFSILMLILLFALGMASALMNRRF